MRVVVLLGALVSVGANCPNFCSGHGNCNNQEQCECYLEGKVLNKDGNLDTDTRLAQWTGADCSEMTCPRGISWTHASGTQAHEHGRECSDMGICNRLTGQCTCHDGYGGIACARSNCPNNCNGHGMCRSNQQFAEKYARAMSSSTNLKYFLPKCTDSAGIATQYEEENCARDVEHIDDYFHTFMVTYNDAWDSNLQWGCDCDAGFFGPDCSLRECPSNYDPLDENCEGLYSTVEDLMVQTSENDPIILTTTDPDETAEAFGEQYADYIDQFDKEYILQYDKGDFIATFKHFGDVARSMVPLNFPTSQTQTDSETLQGAVTSGSYILPISADQIHVKNRFDPIAIKTEFCSGRLKAQECSGRGLCDYATGLCTCFAGYSLEDCSEVEELV